MHKSPYVSNRELVGTSFCKNVISPFQPSISGYFFSHKCNIPFAVCVCGGRGERTIQTGEYVQLRCSFSHSLHLTHIITKRFDTQVSYLCVCSVGRVPWWEEQSLTFCHRLIPQLMYTFLCTVVCLQRVGCGKVGQRRTSLRTWKWLRRETSVAQ